MLARPYGWQLPRWRAMVSVRVTLLVIGAQLVANFAFFFLKALAAFLVLFSALCAAAPVFGQSAQRKVLGGWQEVYAARLSCCDRPPANEQRISADDRQNIDPFTGVRR